MGLSFYGVMNMSFQKGQKIYLKSVPPVLYGTITHIIDEGSGEDPSIVFQPQSIRRRASNFESAEIPEAPLEKFVRVMNGPLGQIPAQWNVDRNNPELLHKMFELFSELGWLKPLPKK
jgi:hypothetical protein